MQTIDPFVVTLQEWLEVFMQRSMRNFIRHSKDCGLSMPQIGALFHIHRKGNSGVTDLGDDLGVTSAAASQMLERLVQQGLILRSEGPTDRRIKQLALTPKGHQALQESVQARQGWLDNLAETLSDGEKEQIRAALTILIHKAKQLKLPNEPER
jgi:DNA-binding MarR family transcriptional regulator